MKRPIPSGYITAAIILTSGVMVSPVSANPLSPGAPAIGLHKTHYGPMYPSYAPAAPYAPVRSRRVVIADERFTPAQIVIFPGQTVIWRNNDDEAHTVTARDGSWDSGVLPPGARFRLSFMRPGVYYYYCRIHPHMRGRIVVRG